LKAQALYAVEANVVELREFDVDERGLGPDGVLVKTLCSAVSPGTELDCLSGRESSWFHFPQQLGYCAVGEVLAVGDGVGEYEAGDIVLAASGHATHAAVELEWTRGRVPPGCDPRDAVWGHLAVIAMTALRASTAELGDHVVVLGQGLIGNFAAQLFRAQGARVIAVERIAARLDAARQCGIELVVDASTEESVAAVRDLTGGRGAEVVVEATGSAAAALQGMEMAASNGEMILLGTPRGSYEADIIPLLRAVHRASPNLTLKGAHGSSLPATPDPFVKHSVRRNMEIALGMIQRGELCLKPLLSRMARPEQGPEVYRELRDHPEKLLGVMFDWQRGG
jgi:threonine dehydrogenase-like Zn-dependent dehydrogenase